MAKNFHLGDLVWAKMKGYPPWPGEIIRPRTKCPKSQIKKPQHYVFFFGSNNHAWIADKNILQHNQYLIEKHGKKKIPAFQKAVSMIIEKSVSRAGSEGAALPKFKYPESALDTSLESTNSNSEGTEVYIPDISEPQVQFRYVDTDSEEFFSDMRESASTIQERYEETCTGMLNLIAKIDNSTRHLLSPFPEGTCVKRPDTPPLDLLEESAELLQKKIEPSHRKIGFLGLGNIGQRIVKKLQESGHNVIIWNRTREKLDPFLNKLNFTVASTPADVVSAADITFCCVSDAYAVKAIVLGNNGVIEALRSCPGSNKGYIEMTSMDYNSNQEIEDKIKLTGGRYLEAPLKGSRRDADNGTLFIHAAGDKSLYDECKSCFDAIANKHKYLGDVVGCASKIHAIYGMFIGATYCSLAETLAFTEQTNIEAVDLFKEMNGSIFKSFIEKCQSMLHNNDDTQTPLKHVEKNLSLGLELGSAIDQPTPIVAAASDILKRCKALGYGDHDVSAVSVVYKKTKP